MKKIYIARHGQNEDNANGILNGHRDKPLTLLGILQAENLAQEIKELEINFEYIFCSPLDRAYTTAKIIADAQNMELELLTGNILLVCHGDIGKMIYATFYDLDWKEVLENFHFGNSELLLLQKDSHPDHRHVVKHKQYNH